MLLNERKGWSVPCPDGESPCSRVIFQGLSHQVGTFRCSAAHPRWQRPNYVVGWGVVLFPRVPVRIEPHAGGGGVIDPGRAMLLEADDLYERARVCAAVACGRGYAEVSVAEVPVRDPGDATATLDTWYEVAFERPVANDDELESELRYALALEKTVVR